MTTRTPRVAANPIPYWSRGGVTDKSPAVFEEAFMGNTGRSTNQLDQHEFPADFFATQGGPGRMSDAHKHQYLDFLDALDAGGAVRIGLHENRLAISIIAGVYESARTGLPVRLV